MAKVFDEYVKENGKYFNLMCKASSIEEGFYDERKKPKKVERNFSANPTHPNALVINCVQVSTFYNKNDHYFMPSELWAAKDTSKYQIVDWEHDREQIIGCISDSYAVSEDGTVLDNSFEVQDDTNFDICNEVVVWQKQYPEYAEKIKKMYEMGSLFVSMECTFEDFDFAIKKEDEKDCDAILVERNEETDFLTDHLLIFGGEGKYKDYRVGAAFRGISFLGVGFVENPANERSFVLDVAGSAKAPFKDIDMESLIESNKIQKNIEKNKKNIEEVEKSGVSNFEEAKLSAKCVAQDIKEGDESMEYKELYEKAEVELKEAKEKIASLEKEVVDTKAMADDLEKDSFDKVKALEEEKAELTKKIEEIGEKLAKIEDERKREARKAAVANKDVDITEEDLFAMSDEAFEAMVKFAPEKAEEVKTEKESKEEDVAEEATEEVEKIEKDKQEADEAVKKEVEAYKVIAKNLRAI